MSLFREIDKECSIIDRGKVYKQKQVVENFPSLSELFQNINWNLSDGSRYLSILSSILITVFNIDTVLEIGGLYGFSSLLLGRALECVEENRGLLVTCDIDQSRCNQIETQTKNLFIIHKVICKDSLSINFEEYLEGRKAGLAFIDGNHTYKYVKNDIEKCLLCGSKFIVVHDYRKDLLHHVVKAVDEFVKEHKWKMLEIPERDFPIEYPGVILYE